MASFTTSLEDNLGSDVVVPGRGFLLNNQLTDFTSTPGDANGGAYLACFSFLHVLAIRQVFSVRQVHKCTLRTDKPHSLGIFQ